MEKTSWTHCKNDPVDGCDGKDGFGAESYYGNLPQDGHLHRLQDGGLGLLQALRHL